MAGKQFIQPTSARIEDETTERAVRNHAECIRELQTVEVVRGKLIKGIELTDGDDIVIAHGLGRPATVFVSPPLNPTSTGRIEEVRSTSYDNKNMVVLQANGFGATVTVSVWVF